WRGWQGPSKATICWRSKHRRRERAGATSTSRCAPPARRCRRDGTSVTDGYQYPQPVLDELARHGLHPRPSTSPEQLRDAVRDLYRYEIRRLRTELLAGRIPKREYAGHVVELRKRYPLLSLRTDLWTVGSGR